MKNWTKEELSIQEEKELNIQAYFSAIGDIKGTTKLLPSNEELNSNNRARSSKLRIIERIK